MKPYVTGLKDEGGWFYAAHCPKCDWSFNWGHDAEYHWDYIQAVAIHHWWTYSDTPSHK